MNRFLVSAAVVSTLVVTGLVACSPKDDGKEAVITDPAKLSAPPSGQGFQLRTELFPVAAGEEVQNCYFFKVSDLAKSNGMPENEPVNLHRVEIVQKVGSHHMNIFRVKSVFGLDPTKGTVLGKNGQGECFKSPNWADWPLVANTQQAGQLDWTFPDGVANVFQPDEWLMLQSHFVNATSQQSPEGGEVAVNFHTIAKDQVKAEMGTVFATKQSIRVCKGNPNPTFTGSCQFKNDKPAQIIGANGHFHGRGKQFDMFNWDGKSIEPDTGSKFYESRVWDEPPMLRSPELNLAVPPGGGIQYSCTYQWTPPTAEAGGCEALDTYDVLKHPDAKPDCCYTFGPIVEKNEHCNAFVYYYPKQ
ncbi:MAG: hypothetical protein JWP97_3142, partial [Labilithrix sp.]|nr:hypothetical protein [Labilithrix sp.]